MKGYFVKLPQSPRSKREKGRLYIPAHGEYQITYASIKANVHIPYRMKILAKFDF